MRLNQFPIESKKYKLVLHKPQLAPFRSPTMKMFKKTRNPINSQTNPSPPSMPALLVGKSSPMNSKDPVTASRISNDYEGLVGLKMLVGSSKELMSELNIPIEKYQTEANIINNNNKDNSQALSIKLCDSKYNEIYNVQIPEEKLVAPTNTDSATLLQNYIEKCINPIMSEKNLQQKSVMYSPREFTSFKMGSDPHITLLDGPSMMVMGKASGPKPKNVSLTRLLLSQQMFPELDSKNPQKNNMANLFERKLDPKKQLSGFNDFINISCVDIKTRPKEMKKYIYNISKKSGKREKYKIADPQLRSKILNCLTHGINTNIDEYVDVLLTEKGEIVVRAKGIAPKPTLTQEQKNQISSFPSPDPSVNTTQIGNFLNNASNSNSPAKKACRRQASQCFSKQLHVGTKTPDIQANTNNSPNPMIASKCIFLVNIAIF